MKGKRLSEIMTILLSLIIIISMMPAGVFALDDTKAGGTVAPTAMWLDASEASGIPARIDLFRVQSGTSYIYQLFLPGNANIANCFFTWDGDMETTVGGNTYASGECPIPAPGETATYSFGNGTPSFSITTFRGSSKVPAVFIDIDESEGNPTIAQMDADKNHDVTCTGTIYINGDQYVLDKMKGRGNASWDNAQDKKPYNITLGSKINFPGINSDKTKKWSLLAEVLDHSLMCNRAGYHLAHEMGIGQDTASADVWMNGEYQGCYTVTPKTDSFVTKDGFMIEQDNYLEDSVAEGGDPQFTLDGLIEASGYGWTSRYNRITVKKMGDNLLGKNDAGEVDESPENLVAKAAEIQSWLQDAWDAIRSDSGYNSKGFYYTDYIDIESFAKMYLMHEYVKSYDVCAGSILFHRDGQTDNDKLIAGPIWDLDNAMGSVYQNSSLGKADNRRDGDRRSGEGSFIPNVTEYKTSIYKTISKHEDFMEEVNRQYNKNRAKFDNLDVDVEQMKADIAASAMMNHNKVNDLGHTTGKNNHYYGSQTNLGSGQYSQTYEATTNSKTDWGNYADNLITYINTRSLWFRNTYYDPNYVDPATCEHQYAETVVPATCTAEGSKTYTCPICGDSYSETIPKIPHNYQDGACTVCHETLINVGISCGPGASVTVYETQGIDGSHEENATSAHPRDSDTGMIDCSGTGQVNFVVNIAEGYDLVSVNAEPSSAYKSLKLPAETGVTNGYRVTKVAGDFTITVTTACKHSNMVHHTAVTAACEAVGSEEYWSCSTCGKYFSDAEGTAEIAENSWTVSATGHTPVTDAAISATCTATGLTEGSHCSVCGKVLAAQETTSALGHDWSGWSETTPATCTEKGVETRMCGRCGESETRETEKLAHTSVTDAAIPATCTAAGLTEGSHCSVCGKVLAAQETTSALGHDWSGWSETTPATCTEKGVETRMCGRCGESETRETEKLAHTSVTDSAVPATCTAAGLTEGSHCSVCGKVLVAQETTSALGHDWSGWSETTPATCTEKGVETRTCGRCGESETRETEKLAHTSVTDAAVPATCTAAGLTEGSHCSVCGKVLAAQEITAALGHNFGPWEEITAGTCENQGVQQRACGVCGYTETQNLDPNGHDWEDTYTVDVEATCITDGSKSFHCRNCDAVTGSAVVPATGHTLTHFPEKAATASSAGNIEYWYCSTCKKYFADADGKTEIAQAATIIPKLPDDTGGGSSGGDTPSGGGGSSGGGPSGGGGGVAPGGDTPENDEPTITPEDEAKPVNEAISALSPDFPDPAAVAAARDAYEKLSDEAKKSVPVETLKKLEAAEATVIANEQKAEGAETVTPKGTVTVTSTENKTVAFTAAPSSKKSVVIPESVKIAGETFIVTEVSSGAFKDTAATTVTISKNIKKVRSKAFSGSKATKLIVKSKKLTKKSVKNSLKGSKVKTVKVKVGTWKQNKAYVKKYKKIFTKTNAGKKVTVK